MIKLEKEEALIEYVRPNKAQFTELSRMTVSRGTIRDWEELHDLHYKAETLPAGPNFYACRHENGALIGIVVLSTVSLLLAARHEMLPKLKPGADSKLANTHRAVWLNANMRRAARIVVDTMYRGIGVAYRMVNIACRMSGYRYVEIQSSMSKFNPFDTKAGFIHAKLRNSQHYESGIEFFRSWFESNPADHEAVVNEFLAMHEYLQKKVLEECRKFYYAHSSREKTGTSGAKSYETSRVTTMGIDTVIKELQQLVFASPVYGLYENPDYGRTLPESIPLTAYDLQSVREPLKIELLEK